MEEMIAGAAAELNLQVDSVREYLTECLTFEMGVAEQAGLDEFYRRARADGLID